MVIIVIFAATLVLVFSSGNEYSKRILLSDPNYVHELEAKLQDLTAKYTELATKYTTLDNKVTSRIRYTIKPSAN